MRQNAFSEREPICPINWQELDGWKGEPASFIKPVIDKMNAEFAAEGFEAYWLLQDFYRVMKLEPYIMLGVRPAGSEKSILIAFGFSYVSCRNWPPGFAEHYAAQVCAHYKLFEDDVMMPPRDASESALSSFCEANGVQRGIWTLPMDNFAAPQASKPDPFDFEDAVEVHCGLDPFDELEQEDPLS